MVRDGRIRHADVSSLHGPAEWIPFRRRNLANGLFRGCPLASRIHRLRPLIDCGLADGLVLAAVTGLVVLVWAIDATDQPEQHCGVKKNGR
jgi:hypothetical protein